MDLHEFTNYKMYFDEDISDEVDMLLKQASDTYPDDVSEDFLLKAFELSPESLTVLIGIYRFYYYQHRYYEALATSEKILLQCQKRLMWKREWSELKLSHIAQGVINHSMGMVRLYLTTLKCAGYINVRVGKYEEGIRQLTKVIELDKNDRLSTQELMATIVNRIKDIKQCNTDPKEFSHNEYSQEIASAV